MYRCCVFWCIVSCVGPVTVSAGTRLLQERNDRVSVLRDASSRLQSRLRHETHKLHNTGQ